MNATTYLIVRIAWAVGKVLMTYVKDKQEILTVAEKREWNRQWTDDFKVGE